VYLSDCHNVLAIISIPYWVPCLDLESSSDRPSARWTSPFQIFKQREKVTDSNWTFITLKYCHNAVDSHALIKKNTEILISAWYSSPSKILDTKMCLVRSYTKNSPLMASNLWSGTELKALSAINRSYILKLQTVTIHWVSQHLGLTQEWMTLIFTQKCYENWFWKKHKRL